jgi:hypothetical protein
MREQQPLALPPPAGAAHWGEQVLFNERVTAALGSVNGAFLSLAAELHAQRPGMPALGLPAHVVTALARALGGARDCGLSLALFDLRFRDERHWRKEALACRAVHDGQGGAETDAKLRRVTRSAVMLAWHLVQTEPRAARLALGMEPATQEVLSGIPIGSLDALGHRMAGSLCARFCTRERFWSQVIAVLRFGPQAGRLDRLRLFGLQLQGAEAARAQLLHRRLRRSTQP